MRFAQPVTNSDHAAPPAPPSPARASPLPRLCALSASGPHQPPKPRSFVAPTSLPLPRTAAVAAPARAELQAGDSLTSAHLPRRHKAERRAAGYSSDPAHSPRRLTATPRAPATRSTPPGHLAARGTRTRGCALRSPPLPPPAEPTTSQEHGPTAAPGSSALPNLAAVARARSLVR